MKLFPICCSFLFMAPEILTEYLFTNNKLKVEWYSEIYSFRILKMK